MTDKSSDLYQRISEWFDATDPENRLALYREKLEHLPQASKLGKDRLEVFTRNIRTSLDVAEKRINAGADWHEINSLLEEARHGLLNAFWEPYAATGAKVKAARQGPRQRFSCKLVVGEIREALKPHNVEELIFLWRDGITSFGGHEIECWFEDGRYFATVCDPQSTFYKPDHAKSWSESTVRDNW